MIYTDVNGRKVADPTKTSLQSELTNPVFLGTQLLSLLSLLVVVFTAFHFSVGVDVVNSLRPEVTALASAIVVIMQAIFAGHHLGVKKLEVAAVAVYKDVVPVIETVDPKITPVINQVTPVVNAL